MIYQICLQNKIYEINLEKISQWCGQNLILKNDIVDCFAHYFASYKYANVQDEKIMYSDGKEVGRRYYQTTVISNRDELLHQIANMKTGLLIQLIKNQLGQFDYQKMIDIIDDELLNIYSDIEQNLISKIGNISLGYERSELMDIIQKSVFETENGEDISSLSTKELLDIYLNLIKEQQNNSPECRLIILKNIDHLILKEEYYSLISKVERISDESETWFVLTTSLEHFCVISEKNIEGITVFNDAIYCMPPLEKLTLYFNENYPYSRDLKYTDVISYLEESIHRIALNNDIQSIDSYVCIKLLNSSMGMTNCLKEHENRNALAFLYERKMV